MSAIQNDTSEILIEIQKNIAFFRKIWNKFCKMVEEDGRRVEECRNDPTLRVKEVKNKIKLQEKLKKIYKDNAIICPQRNEAYLKGDYKTTKRLEKSLINKNREAKP